MSGLANPPLPACLMAPLLCVLSRCSKPLLVDSRLPFVSTANLTQNSIDDNQQQIGRQVSCRESDPMQLCFFSKFISSLESCLELFYGTARLDVD